MISQWPTHAVDDLCLSIVDCLNRTAPVVEGPTLFRMIRTTNVRDGFVDLTETRFVEEEVFKTWTRRQMPEPGDVILTREAPLGEVGLLRGGHLAFLGQRLVSYRANPDLLDNRYLLYYLRSEYGRAQVLALGSGSTVHHMRVPEAKQLRIPTPPIEVQQRIGAILGTYDDLIEVNRHRVRLLEDMSSRLYQEWFVRFRFPGHEDVVMVNTPHGPMPAGWQTIALSHVADINARSLRPASAPERIGYIDIASVSPGQVDDITWMAFADAPNRARRSVRDGSILWSNVRPNRRSFAYLVNPTEAIVASTGFTVIDATSIPSSYLYAYVTTDAFVAYLVGRATGAAYPAVTASVFNEALVVVPPGNLLKAFDALAAPILRMAASLRSANHRLAAARDLLLPRLVSGQLSVATAERELLKAA